jgi:hypothetical protein
VPAVHLQDLVDVGAGYLQGDQHLDHELVTRRRDELRRRPKPRCQRLRAFGGDPVPLLLLRSVVLVVGLHEPVALKTLKCRVNLADVQRPDLAGPRLELVLQPQAVLRLLAQERQESVGNTHERLSDLNIPSMYTKYRQPTQVAVRLQLPKSGAGEPVDDPRG